MVKTLFNQIGKFNFKSFDAAAPSSVWYKDTWLLKFSSFLSFHFKVTLPTFKKLQSSKTFQSKIFLTWFYNISPKWKGRSLNNARQHLMAFKNWFLCQNFAFTLLILIFFRITHWLLKGLLTKRGKKKTLKCQLAKKSLSFHIRLYFCVWLCARKRIICCQ